MEKIIKLKISSLERYSEVTSTIQESNYLFEDEYKKIEKIFKELLVENSADKEEFNNIISIIGDRGAGKSSFMKSFLKKIEEKIKKIKVIPVIDPSKFIKGTEALELIIGYIFEDFKRQLEEITFENDFDRKRDLLENFSKVHKGIKYVKGEKSEGGNNLDNLLEISEAINLDKNIKNLIKKYLEFIKKEKVIIPIDDLDLNTQHVYQTIENLRKYLMGGQVIILLAIKYDQLENSVKDNFYREYDKIRDFYGIESLKDEIEDRTYKYLLKILPYDRRIYLSSPFEDKLKKAFLKEEEENEKKIVTIKITEEVKEEETIEEYINNKIGQVCPINSGRHELIPNNLRELIFFILSIHKIAGIQDGKKLEEFKRFFFEYWISEKLSYKEKFILKNMDREQTLVEKNRVIYNELKNIVLYFKKNTEEMELNLRNFLLLDNSEIIKIGDVRSLIEILKKKKKHLDFIFAIEVLYNCLLKKNTKIDNNGFFIREIDTLENNLNYDISIYNYVLLKGVLENKKINEELKEVLFYLDKVIDTNEYLYKNKRLNSLEKIEENIYIRIALSNLFEKDNLNIDKLIEKEKEVKSTDKISEKLKILEIKIDKEKLALPVKNLKKLLEEMYNFRNEEKSNAKDNNDQTKAFKKYKNELIENIISKKQITNEDILDNILFTIKSKTKNKQYNTALEYFLRGTFDQKLEDKELAEHDKDVFLGVIGEFYKRDILLENGIEIKESKKLLKNDEIIQRFDERGSLVELLHLNDLTLNDTFVKEETDILEVFIKNNLEWYRR